MRPPAGFMRPPGGPDAPFYAALYGLRKKTRVWKSGRSVAETRTGSTFRVYMTYRDLVMAALSCWWLICGF